jgi:autotransporter-associated beta strand protein
LGIDGVDGIGLTVGSGPGVTGTVIQNGGAVHTGYMSVGGRAAERDKTGTGYYILNGGSLTADGALTIGNSGTGTFTQTAGTTTCNYYAFVGSPDWWEGPAGNATSMSYLNVSGGTFISNPYGLWQTGSSGTINITGTGVVNTAAVMMGQSGVASGLTSTLNLSGNGELNVSSWFNLGADSTYTATVNQSGGTSNISLLVSYNGTGVYNLSGGTSHVTTIGDYQPGTGNVTHNVTGGVLNVGTLNNGNINVSSVGKVNITYANAGGTVSVSTGGTANIGTIGFGAVVSFPAGGGGKLGASTVNQDLVINNGGTFSPGGVGIAGPAVFTQTNLALGKSASQLGSSSGYPASLAVDGNYTNFTQTDDQLYSWWNVDLGSDTALGKIKLYNRVGGPWDSLLSNFTVSVLDSSYNPVWTSAPYYPTTGWCPALLSIDLPTGTTGEFIQVQFADPGTNNGTGPAAAYVGAASYLCLAEVEAYAPGNLLHNYTQTAGTTLSIEMGPTYNKYDSIQAGVMTLDGTLKIGKLAASGQFHEGQTFKILDWQSLSGWFASSPTLADMPALQQSFLEWDISQLAATGTVSVKMKAGASYPVQSDVWKLPGGGTWHDTSSWVGGNIPNGAINPLNPNPGAGVNHFVQVDFSTNLTSPGTVTVDGPKTVGTINFNNSNKYTIAGVGITMQTFTADVPTINVIHGSHEIAAQLTLTADTNVVVNNLADSLTLSYDIAGAGVGINKTGVGRLIISGTTSYTGTTTIAAGTLENNSSVDNGDGSSTTLLALSSAANPIFIGPNGTMQVDIMHQTSNPASYSSSTVYTPTISGTGTLRLANPAASLGTGVYMSGADLASFTGTLVVDGGIKVDSTGVDYSHLNIQVNSGGQFAIGFVTSGAASLSIAGQGFADPTYGPIGALRQEAGGDYTGPIVLAADAAISGLTPGADDSVVSTISGNISGAHQLEILPVWSLTNYKTRIMLSGDNTYGSTKVSAVTLTDSRGTFTATATLIAGSSTALSSGGMLLDGGALNLNGFSFSFANLSSTAQGGLISNGTTATDPSTMTVGSDGSSTTYSGTLADGAFNTATLSLIKTGAGALTLSGTLSYTGNTTVNDGTLNVAVLNTPSATVYVATGGTLNAASIVADKLTIGGDPIGMTAAVPEPSTFALLALGVLTLLGWAGRKRR